MRVLFVSGSLGMGHVTRDLAIAQELRNLRPTTEIEWLAGQPARDVLRASGEHVLLESDDFGQNTETAEARAESFGLDLVDYLESARGAWKENVAVFGGVMSRTRYDLIVGDETYELSIALQKDPRLASAPFVLMLDFCGLEYGTGSLLGRVRTYGWNWVWAGGPRARRPVQDQTLFVGEPADIPDRRFGPLLPNRRDVAMRHYTFVGYILGFDPGDLADRSALRARLGYDRGPLIVCSIGGTAIGIELLERCIDAYTPMRAALPDLQVVLVCGPRVDPSRLDAPHGVTVHGYVPKLYEHFAAADLAIVQGGGTTTLELTALRRPFISFPLEGHTEQEVTVADQCRRHGAGIIERFSTTSADELAHIAIETLRHPPTWPGIPTDGARRAATTLAALLDRDPQD